MKYGLSKTDLNNDTLYSLWECVSGYWVIDRSFLGAYFKTFSGFWNKIQHLQETSHCFPAVFEQGFDPNNKHQSPM